MDTRRNGQELTRETALIGDTVDLRWVDGGDDTRVTLHYWTENRIAYSQDGRTPVASRTVDVDSVRLVTGS